jgi:DNA-binding SARP family transcriptional activator
LLGEHGPEAAWALERAARIFGSLGAGVAEAFCLGYAAIAAMRSGSSERASRLAAQARTLAALHEAPAAAGVALLAAGAISLDDRDTERASEVLTPLGTWDWHAQLVGLAPSAPALADQHPEGDVEALPPMPSIEPAVNHNGGPADSPAKLRCLGSYSLDFAGRRVEEGTAKPMERALLHLLSMRVGETVHRETLIEALWPDADPEAGLHRLQVAVSSLRRLLAAAGADGQQVLARDRESYKLVLPEGADVDMRRVEKAFQEASAARLSGNEAAEEQSLMALMSAYGGPLLADDGPVDWVLESRRVLQGHFVDAATRHAEMRMQAGDLVAAGAAARVGLGVDRYRDDLWKLLVEIAEHAGNWAEAEQARRGYEAVLAELGV